MDALKATIAREITREQVTEGGNVALHDSDGALLSQSQQGGMQVGDFYFRVNTVARYEKASWFRRVILGQPEKLFVTHPETVVMSCPFCGLPLMTSFANSILNKRPLTLEKPVQCPFFGAGGVHSFTIKDGNLMPA